MDSVFHDLTFIHSWIYNSFIKWLFSEISVAVWLLSAVFSNIAWNIIIFFNIFWLVQCTNVSICHHCTLYYNLRHLLQTLAQRIKWKSRLLFIIGQPLLLASHPFLFRNPKRKTYLMGSIKINYFVISEIMAWFNSVEVEVLRKKKTRMNRLNSFLMILNANWYFQMVKKFRKISRHRMRFWVASSHQLCVVFSDCLEI